MLRSCTEKDISNFGQSALYTFVSTATGIPSQNLAYTISMMSMSWTSPKNPTYYLKESKKNKLNQTELTK